MSTKYYEFLRAQDYVMAGVNVVLFIGFLAAMWALYNRMTEFDDHKEMYSSNGNVPMVWRRLGLVGGQAFAMTSLFSQPYAQWWHDLLWVTLGGLAIAGFMLSVDRLTEFLGTSLAPSIVRSSFYVSTGLVVGAGFSGSAPSVRTGIIATLIFSILGIGTLIGVFVLNDVLYGIRDYVAANSVPASVLASGFMVGFGIILRNAIAGDFQGWGSAFAGFFITLIIAMFAFYALSWVVDRYIFTDVTLHDIVRSDAVAPAASLAVFQIVLALGITALPIW